MTLHLLPHLYPSQIELLDPPTIIFSFHLFNNQYSLSTLSIHIHIHTNYYHTGLHHHSVLEQLPCNYGATNEVKPGITINSQLHTNNTPITITTHFYHYQLQLRTIHYSSSQQTVLLTPGPHPTHYH